MSAENYIPTLTTLANMLNVCVRSFAGSAGTRLELSCWSADEDCNSACHSTGGFIGIVTPTLVVMSDSGTVDHPQRITPRQKTVDTRTHTHNLDLVQLMVGM